MKIDLKEFQKPAEVRKAQKALPYTVTPIGDINLYHKERTEFEARWQVEYEMHQAERRVKATAGVAEQNLFLEFDEIGKVEIEHRSARNAPQGSPQCTKETCPYSPKKDTQEHIKPSNALLRAVKDFCAQMWRDAFRSER